MILDSVVGTSVTVLAQPVTVKVQQTPKPDAQLPSELPPVLSSHSEAERHVPSTSVPAVLEAAVHSSFWKGEKNTEALVFER